MTYFVLKLGVVPRKATKLENQNQNFPDMFFVTCSRKTWKCSNQNLFTGSWLGIVCVKCDMSNFNPDSLTCDFALFSTKNSPNRAKSNCTFPEKSRGDIALILTYLDSPMTEILHHKCLFFSIWAIFRGKRSVKVGSKVLGSIPFP